METLTWWQGGLALAGVMLLHWLILHRMMAVSGRVSALINLFRGDDEEEDDGEEMSAEELQEALRAMTAEEFGEDALGEAEEIDDEEPPVFRKPQPTLAHVLFFVGLAAGGALSALIAGGVDLAHVIRGETFLATYGDGPWVPAILVVGGMFVGFGTRMASGCTTGHGLCGVSRLQVGSLIATGAFFGSAVITSLILMVVR